MREELNHNNLKWLNITSPTPEFLEKIKNEHNFHDLDMEDCKSKVQRPKLEEYDDYKFLVLQFPVENNQNYRLRIEEVDIFLGNNFLITIQNNSLKKITDIFKRIKNDKDVQKKYFSFGSNYLLYKILQELVLGIFPIMTKIGTEIDILDNIFEKIKPNKLIERISALRRNIIFLQTSLKPQRSIFLLFENTQDEKSANEEMDIYWGDIGDGLGKILDMAEDYQELIEGLYSSIDTLLSYRINSIMKTLTIFSVIMLPLTFITSFYGMNIALPLQKRFGESSLLTVGILSGIMIAIAVVMWLYFKIRRF